MRDADYSLRRLLHSRREGCPPIACRIPHPRYEGHPLLAAPHPSAQRPLLFAHADGAALCVVARYTLCNRCCACCPLMDQLAIARRTTRESPTVGSPAPRCVLRLLLLRGYSTRAIMPMHVLYCTTSGCRQPVADFIAGLPAKTQAATLTALERVDDCGLDAPGVSFRMIRGTVWEIRIRSATAILTALDRVED